MNRLACVSCIVALTLGACSSDNGDDTMGSGTGSGTGTGTGSGTGTGTGTGTGGDNLQPRAGAWIYDEVTPVSNTCGSLVDQGEGGGGFEIDQVMAASFRIVPGDGTAAFVCNLDGPDFDCPNRYDDTTDYNGMGVDAVVTIHGTAEGTFSDDSNATGSQEATASCSGSQCGVLPVTFPCSATVDFVVSAL